MPGRGGGSPDARTDRAVGGGVSLHQRVVRVAAKQGRGASFWAGREVCLCASFLAQTKLER
jgi:hypothetical protein